MKKHFILVTAVVACALSVYAFWPSKKVNPVKAERPSEHREEKPFRSLAETSQRPARPSPIQEPVQEPAPEPLVESTVENTPPAEGEELFEPTEEEQIFMAQQEGLQNLFYEFEELTKEVDTGKFDNETLDREIREVVDLMVPLMEQTGMSEMHTPNGWTVYRNQDGTYGYGK